MNKRLKVLIMAVMVLSTMIFSAMSAFALTEGDWEFQLLDDEVLITGYLGDGGNVVIPDTIYGRPVTDIEFSTCSIQNATSVIIPGSIKQVPATVFWNSDVLETVILEEGVEVIEGGAEFGAFENCPQLSKVVLPSTLKRIENFAFEYCGSLKEIEFPAGLNFIGIAAFEHSGLVQLDLSGISSDATIKRSSFAWCENLVSVKLNPGLKEIPSNIFSYCKSLEYVEIPNTVTYIGTDAFENCSSLKSLILPTSLKTLCHNSLNGTAITELVIPYGTEEVQYDIFEDNAGLKAIYIPDTVKHMSTSPIEDCPNCIVYCGTDSYAAKQCKANKVSYLTDNSVNSTITVLYNGTRISFHSYGQNPELLESRTLVPLRSIFEAMGADVDWDQTTSTAIAKRDGVEIKIQIGANEMYKDGNSIPVDVPARLLNDRTMVPVRVIAEAFGADVQWNQNGRTVLISE